MIRRLAAKLANRVADRIAVRLGGKGGAERADRAARLAAKLCIERVRKLPDASPLSAGEFQVYSQWGEDGIIQFLISRVPLASRTFVEFGVQDYTESNTRFLLINDDWSGLVIDSSQEDVDFIRSDRIYWRHDLHAECAFITRDNINGLISARFPGEELGILSVDIDGNDHWIWEAITCVRPSIVICEYNSVFGDHRAVTIPYDAVFDRTKAHHSNLYYGASLAAFCRLAERKGYAFVGSNSAGNNAFFVRSDRLTGLKALTAKQGYVESKYRESRGPDGRLNYLAGVERLRAISALPLVDLEAGQTRPIRELFADELSAKR